MQSVPTTTAKSTALAAPAWRSAAYRQASPALQAIIAACLTLDAELKSARAAMEPIKAAMRAARGFATDAALRDAIAQVPVPAELRVPKPGAYVVSVELKWSNGTTTTTGDGGDPMRSLTDPDEINQYFATDAERVAAHAALAHYRRACNAAMAVVNRAARTPESIAAQAAFDDAYKTRLRPLHRRYELALTGLRKFQAENAHDRLAQILALFHAHGGAISRTGAVRGLDDAFDSTEGAKLAALMFQALAAAADESPSPADARVDEDTLANAPDYARGPEAVH